MEGVSRKNQAVPRFDLCCRDFRLLRLFRYIPLHFDDMAIATINPATGELLRSFDPLTEEALDEKLQLAVTAFSQYRSLPIEARAQLMRKAAELLETEKESLGQLMTIEMGKPIRAAIEEAAKCAWACRYYADNAADLLADEPVETSASSSYIKYQPIGPVLAIMPWKCPWWQVCRFIAQAMSVFLNMRRTCRSAHSR